MFGLQALHTRWSLGGGFSTATLGSGVLQVHLV